jgi:hypothetical protein
MYRELAENFSPILYPHCPFSGHLLGRSSSIFRLSAWISIPLGDALAGIISQGYGTKVYFIMASYVLFIVSVLCVCVKLHRAIPSIKPNDVARGA